MSIQLTGSVIVPNGIFEVPLNVTKFLISVFSKLALDADHGFERRIKVRNAQAEELRKFCDELIIEQIKHLFGLVVLLLDPRNFCGVVTWLCKRFVELAAGRVIVKQLKQTGN